MHEIKNELILCLTAALENNQLEFDENDTTDMIELQYGRKGIRFVGSGDTTTQHAVIGFSLELPERVDFDEALIEDFIQELSASDFEFHIVKFEDPLQRKRLADWVSEIYELEMKLRRVLTLMYLHAYQNLSPYELLTEEKTTPKSGSNEQQMRSATENEFFHLLFSDYIRLNQRTTLRFQDVLGFIMSHDEYDAFRAEVLRLPIEDEIDAALLANLTELMDPIERMRNCIAHNRRPSKGLLDSYPKARLSLEERLDDYLARWEL